MNNDDGWFIKYVTFAFRMKPLTLEAYKLLYFLTGSKVFSYYAAVVIVTILTTIVLMGLSILLEGIIPTKSLQILFKFPYFVGTGIALFLLNLKLVPMSFMELTNHVKVRYIKLLLYVAVAIIILAYKALLKIV